MTSPGTVLTLVGNTPLVELTRLNPKPNVHIFAKLEGQNPSGSIKDRTALALVEDAETRGLLQPGGALVEASSGNMALALALVGKQKGYRVQAVVPTGIPPGLGDLLSLHGADVVWCEPRAGMKGAIDRARECARDTGGFLVRQFESGANPRIHYETTGLEIATALTPIDAFVAGIGTGGTVMGVGKRLRESNPGVKIIGVEPRMGEHLQGLRSLEEGYIPPLLDLNSLDGRFMVDTATALARVQEVLELEGLFVGVSSGAVLHGALRVAAQMDQGNVVALFADGGWKYLPARPWHVADEGIAPQLDEVHWW